MLALSLSISQQHKRRRREPNIEARLGPHLLHEEQRGDPQLLAPERRPLQVHEALAQPHVAPVCVCTRRQQQANDGIIDTFSPVLSISNKTSMAEWLRRPSREHKVSGSNPKKVNFENSTRKNWQTLSGGPASLVSNRSISRLPRYTQTTQEEGEQGSQRVPG